MDDIGEVKKILYQFDWEGNPKAAIIEDSTVTRQIDDYYRKKYENPDEGLELTPEELSKLSSTVWIAGHWFYNAWEVMREVLAKATKHYEAKIARLINFVNWLRDMEAVAVDDWDLHCEGKWQETISGTKDVIAEAKKDLLKEIEGKYRATRRSRISDLVLPLGIYIPSKDWQALKKELSNE